MSTNKPATMVKASGSACSLQRTGVLTAMCSVTVLVWIFFYSPPAPSKHQPWLPPAPVQKLGAPGKDILKGRGLAHSVPAAESARCEDVLRAMTQGHWQRLPMTPADVQKMKEFHRHVREVEQGLPRGLQRKDGLCGNVTFLKKRGTHANWFRAVCDAEGDRPCCYHNRCVNRSADACACPQCFDMRNPLHAEYAQWRPVDGACAPERMSVEEMCGLLDNATLYFLGDSLVRHVYTAFLMTVRGDPVAGAFRRNMPQALKNQCSGIYMFTEKECRHWVDGNVRVCPGQRTHLRLFYSLGVMENLPQRLSPLQHQPRSLVFVGFGAHKMNATAIFQTVMRPLLVPDANNTLPRRPRWPQLVWAGIHHWGTLKSPGMRDQSLRDVARFNREMEGYLRPFGVPVFDTFNMTAEVESFDGAHYGWGVNRVKVEVLLSFLKELRSKNRW